MPSVVHNLVGINEKNNLSIWSYQGRIPIGIIFWGSTWRLGKILLVWVKRQGTSMQKIKQENVGNQEKSTFV